MYKVGQTDVRKANSVGMNQQRAMSANYIPTDSYRLVGC